MRGAFCPCSSPLHSPGAGAFPEMEGWDLPFCRWRACSVPTAWKQGDGLAGPTWRKKPLPGEQQGSAGKALARRTQTLLPSPSLISDSRAAGDVPPAGVPMGALPQRPSFFPRRQRWDMGFSEHFPSVYHSSEVCDVRPLMDASIHRLDIMMYREPRDI